MKKIAIVVIAVVVLCIAMVLLYAKVIKPNIIYNSGFKAMETANYDEAAAIFESLGEYKDASTQALESQYQKATALNEAGKYEEAYAVYAALSGYKDVDSIIENDDNIAAAAWRSHFEVGKTVAYGTYEQDGNTANGAEAIEWIVLKSDGKTATLISKNGLDAKRYNEESVDVTWESCTLREWLNDVFLNTAFSTWEQARIETVKVAADKNPSYSTDPGNDTQDKVFLLSIAEVNVLFNSADARKCQATAYAKAQGVSVDESSECWWWLRSPGSYTSGAAAVNSVGSLRDYGSAVDSGSGAVRPVVCLRLS